MITLRVSNRGNIGLLPSRIVCLKCRRWTKRGTEKAKEWALARCPACLAIENPPGRCTYVEITIPIMARPMASALVTWNEDANV